MSEQILKALMQLFAIIARPQSNPSERRVVVQAFLRRQLNQELVKEYLRVFDRYYTQYQNKFKGFEEEEKKKRHLSASSVRILKICTEINEELVLSQKIIVLFQILEFIKSEGKEITSQEMEFYSTVSEVFHLTKREYDHIKDFVLQPFDNSINTNQLLIISNQPKPAVAKTKYIFNEGLNGQIRVLHVASAQMYLLRFIGKNEIHLNGQIIQQDKVYVLNPGTSIRNPHIKPIYFSDIITSFNKDKHRYKIVFEANSLEYNFKNGKPGLHNMSFNEESGRLVGIMGASGAGKSTLLNVLNGSVQPNKGQVLINGVNIHAQKNEIDGLIGYVSQDDLLIEELTVFQNLYYNAKLCFSKQSDDLIVFKVEKILQNLGLDEIKHVQVGSPLNKKISGGQRKRLNIALELIREPAVLFLDEPTSGLSSRDSENIMDLLKELALKGKLVFVVIHQPSSEIFKMFDRLLILDQGGFLIYNGDPIESIIYFKSRIHQANCNESECHICGNVNSEQIFNIVESSILDEYGKVTHTRRISPKEWNEFYEEYTDKETKQNDIPTLLPTNPLQIPNKFNQYVVFIKRDILSKLSDIQYLIINFFEAPILAFILSYIIKFYNVSVTNEFGYTFSDNSNLPVYLFMSVIVAIFMGLTVSAEEIIKDRKLLKREAFLNLSWAGYLASKISVLFIISAIQALSFILVGNSIIEIKGLYFQYWLLLFTVWASSNVMGLLISDTFKTVVTIYILIPFLVIPQIILSGVIVKYEKLNPTISSPGKIPIYGEILTARWGYEALSVLQFTENEYEKIFYDLNKKMSNAEYKKNYWVLNLRNKIDFIDRNYGKPEEKEKISKYLTLLYNEISKENIKNIYIPFNQVDKLTIEKLDGTVVKSLEEYIRVLNKYYVNLYNLSNNEKDNLIYSFQQTPAEKASFLQLKRDNHNEKLTEFVTNSNEIERIVEYNGQLYRKIDPIYFDPESRFIKSHFYSPRKNFLGKYYSTYWVNIIVIWVFTLIIYLLLYFRIFKRIIDYFGEVNYKVKRVGSHVHFR